MLLRGEPLRSVNGCSEIVAHQAQDVFALWQRWEERTGTRQEPPFWATVWPGAALACRVILDQPQLVRDQRVIDVGCGSGVVAVAAMLSGAREAVANDTNAEAVAAALENAARNGVTIAGLHADLTERNESFGPGDVVVFSELFYDGSSAKALQALAARAASGGARVLIADGGRPFFDGDGLQLLGEKVLPVSESLEGTGQRRARVFAWPREA
jgi:predicted nicotinamide N-methyase